MIYLADMYINTSKKYLVIGKNVTFLERAREIMDSKLDIGMVEDTKSYIDELNVFFIKFKDGGFMRFILYTGRAYLGECDYDKVLVDNIVYANDYAVIRSRCLMADIVCMDIARFNLIELTDDGIIKDDAQNIVNRSYDKVLFMDYGKCPVCDNKVYESEERCPKCNTKLNWKFNKSMILNRCRIYGSYDKNLGVCKTYYDVNRSNAYYDLIDVFGYTKLSNMSDEELNNLLLFAKKITKDLC